MLKKYPYESCFAGLIVKPLVSADKDKCLALASLIEVQQYLPNIDTKTNLDILPVAFNACVINRVNKNKDVVDTQTAVAMYKNFVNKPINVEHNRQKIIGVILTAGFSEFGTDRILTEEQVSKMTSPFNVTLGGVVWRVVAPELADHIEEASDPTSDHYLSVSASWELGFTDYRVALLEGNTKNLSQAKKIISDPAEVDKVKDSLTACGGDGKIEDLFAYRMPSYDVLPLGIGFTEKPAAEVVGVATPDKEKAGITIPEAFDDGSKDAPKEKSIKTPQSGETNKVGIVIPNAFDDAKAAITEPEKENKISQSVETDVKIERNTYMKITSLKDITAENLKECTASAVSDFIAAELEKGSNTWVTEKNALKTQLSESEATSAQVKAQAAELEKQLKDVKATVEALSSEKIAREKVEQFNTRMAIISEAYELDDEARLAIVEDIKAIASDEDFAKWQKKASVLLKGYAKMNPPAKKKDDVSDRPGADKEDLNDKKGNKALKSRADDDDGDDDASAAAKKKKAKADDGDDDSMAKKKAKASEEAQAALDAAAANGEADKGGVPNSSTANAQTLKEKYQQAFSRENFVINI